jgi:integrase/recombinase XerC
MTELNEAITIRPAEAATRLTTPRLAPDQFYTLWRESLDSSATRRTYETSISAFAKYLAAPSTDDAVALLLGMERGSAHALVEGWRADLRNTRSAGTVNARLTALRALVQSARRFGLIDWRLEVENVRAESYRDTRGPGRANYLKMRDACATQANATKALRHTAILRLLHDCGLRSIEVRGLQVTDVDEQGGRVWITGKGRSQREAVTVPTSTMAALTVWLQARGEAPGYVFCRIDRGGHGSFDKPLAHKSVWELVGEYGDAAGVKARPHGLRHQAITTACERTGGDLVKIASFARHRNISTTARYVDNAKDHAGAVARLVADD